MRDMPNKPRENNPGRVIRVEDSLWSKVLLIAEQRGVKPSVIVRDAIKRYVKRPPKGQP